MKKIKITKNTKALRLKIYKLALEHLKAQSENAFFTGICNSITHAFTNDREELGDFSPYGFLADYTELVKYKPANKDLPKSPMGYWFPDNKDGLIKRIEILEEMEK